jgi:hypothetical protein
VIKIYFLLLPWLFISAGLAVIFSGHDVLILNGLMSIGAVMILFGIALLLIFTRSPLDSKKQLKDEILSGAIDALKKINSQDKTNV